VTLTPGFFAFAAACLAVAAATALYVGAWIARKVRRRKEPQRSALAKWTRRDVLGLAGGGIACMAWGYFFEPYRLEVTRTRITSPKLRGATRAIRIVQISDLHCDPKPRNEPKLPRVISDLEPDLIVYTGDSINSPDGLANFRNCLTRIAEIAPTFAVRGNWDKYFGGIDYFGNTRATELDGVNRRLEIAGTRIWVAGAAVFDRFGTPMPNETLDAAIEGIPDEDFKVFLYHYPDLIYSLADRGVDLHLAGHTHGGQVAMPVYGALVTASRFGKRFEAGLYHVHKTDLYVNRGIGMEGRRAPRVRFWCRPEVSLIEIASKET